MWIWLRLSFASREGDFELHLTCIKATQLKLVVVRHDFKLHIYISTSDGDAETAVARVTVCLVDTEAWLKASRLRLNPTKTQIMWLDSPQQLAKVNVLEVPVASTRINVSETAHDLARSLTVSCRCLHRRPPCVAVATTSYGSSDRSSDLCQPRP